MSRCDDPWANHHLGCECHEARHRKEIARLRLAVDDITIRKIDSGYWHVRGRGPCEWTQPARWPASESEIRESAFPQASEKFLLRVIALAKEVPRG